MANAIAYKENCNPVPGTPTYDDDLKEILLDYVEELDLFNQLRSYGNALKVVEKQHPSDRYFILEIMPGSTELSVRGYKYLKTAYEVYSWVEEDIVADSRQGIFRNAVLVSVDKVTELKDAYPNYYLDTTVFLDLVEWAIS